MINRRILVVAFVCLLVFSGWRAVFAKPSLMPEEKAQSYERFIRNCIQTGEFETAERVAKQYEEWLKTQSDVTKGRHNDDLQDLKSDIQAKQGNYEAAASVAEKNAKESKSESVSKKAEAARQNAAGQKEAFEKQMGLSEKIIAKDIEIFKIVKQQKAALDEFIAKNPAPVSKEKLAELQKFMNKTTAEIAAKTKERDSQEEELSKLREKYKDLSYAKDIDKKLKANLGKVDIFSRDLDILQADNHYKFGDISEKFKVEWTGFADKITETHKLQKDMLDLQKKMKELAGKEKLSSEEMKTFADLKGKYAELKAQMEAKVRELQKTYEDASTFADLNAEQAGKLKGLYQDIKKNKTYLDENERKIEASLKKLTNVLYGDANGDGKVDQADTNVIGYILKGDMKKASEMASKGGKKLDLFAADVNGDGYVSKEDHEMIQQKLWGFRKTFPADPKNIPGDMNGNGSIDKEDVRRVEGCVKDPDSRMASFRNIADVNGDGKLDDADKALIGKAYKDAQAKAAEEEAGLNQPEETTKTEGSAKNSPSWQNADTTPSVAVGIQETEPKEKHKAPSSGNPFLKGSKK